MPQLAEAWEFQTRHAAVARLQPAGASDQPKPPAFTPFDPQKPVRPQALTIMCQKPLIAGLAHASSLPCSSSCFLV